MLGFKGIYMSPEDIFAAQMWPWPEPALKRDALGRVLFVNAAFLQMYGGQIDDWRGNLVTGWPAPQPPGMPYRFETRLPSDAGEQIYDWMEFTLADGNAFAVARNVTYLFQTPDPDPGATEQPPYTPEQSVTPATETLSDMIPTGQRNADPLPAFAEQIAAESIPQVPAVQPPLAEPAFQSPAIDSFVAESQETVSDINAEVEADPVFDAASYSSLTDSEPGPADNQVGAYESSTHQAAPIEDPAPEARAVEHVPEERAFERRALPLENEDAVLGNNWRDAVIAKAVGADRPKDDEPEEPDAVAPVSSEGEQGPIRILLAEDNAINALLTRTLLEAEGHTVDTVEDGVLAVEAMKSSKYDLIFMDMRMPNMDGLEATRKIRAMDNVSKGLPIIALTANAFDDDRNACFDSGMNDFMTKPVSAEELSEMVRTWTKNKAERDAA